VEFAPIEIIRVVDAKLHGGRRWLRHPTAAVASPVEGRSSSQSIVLESIMIENVEMLMAFVSGPVRTGQRDT
jgi:hypothetical protein